MVGVIDGSVLVFHYARVISLVRWDHALHDEAPVLVADLEGCKPEVGNFTSVVSPSPNPKETFSE